MNAGNGWTPEGDRDPVAELFTRERGQIVDASADDRRWQRIVREARAQRRSRLSGYAAGLAVAAAAAAAFAFVPGILQNDQQAPAADGPETSAPTLTSSPATPPAPTTATQSTTPERSVTTTGAIPVPASFRAQSMSNSGSNVIYVMGDSQCGAKRCPVLVRSGDNGRGWAVVASFPGFAVQPSSEGVPSSKALSQVRFANPQVGWVFGGGIQVTRDAGKTWHDYGHPGATVLDLETRAGQVVITSADGCTAASCPSALVVSQAPVAADASMPVGTIKTGWVHTGDIQLTPSAAFVNAEGRPVTDKPLASTRLVGGALASVAAPPDVTGDEQVDEVIGSADAGSDVFGFAVSDVSRSTGTGLLVARSTDSAASWTTVSDGALRLVGGPLRSYAAASVEDLVAVSGGDTSPGGSLKVSHDGGATWNDPKSAPRAPANGWRWVGAPGGSTYYAIPVDSAASYWKSTDRGQTWSEVRLRP